MEPRVSIIVPVYNVEQYLRACLDSIVNQTLHDLEILCINDASTDGSADILKEFARQDPRIKILTHATNQGLGAARNTGVAAANADYVGFVDSDDLVDPDMFHLLYNSIKAENSDLSWCGTTSVSENLNIINSESLPLGVFSTEEVLLNPLLYPSILPVWNKLFRRKLFLNIHQLPIIGEDQPAMAEYLIQCKRISIVSSALYFYRKRDNTLSRPKNQGPEQWDHFFHSHILFFDILRQRFDKAEMLAPQVVLRHFSLLWNINQSNLVISSGWTHHRERISRHISDDVMNLRKASPVMHWFLTLIFRYRYPAIITEGLVYTALRLSRGRWVRHRSFLNLPVDIFVSVLVPKLKQWLKGIASKLETTLFFLIGKLFSFVSNKPIWLVSERPDTAQENGIYFFNYLRNKQAGESTWYVLSKNSTVYNRLKHGGRIVRYNSSFHKLLFFACKYYVSSHHTYSAPVSCSTGRRFRLPSSSKCVFLQHGITLTDHSEIYGPKNGIDLFICGGKPEFDYVRERFGFREGGVAFTGFARFDGLHHGTPGRKILLMPSWRKSIWESGRHRDPTCFQTTRFFKEFQHLINHPVLVDMLERWDYELLFYPHYETQKYLNLFSVPSPRVKLVSFESASVQQLLIDAALLLTDSSSVSFDFGYMYKPVVYYHFQEDPLAHKELQESFFSDREFGFGEVVEDMDSLLTVLEQHLSAGCQMTSFYRSRVDRFFPLHDQKNSERIYEAILEQ